MSFKFLKKLRRDKSWEDLLDQAERKQVRRVLLYWNRGLGDIALGLHQVIAEIRMRLRDVELTIVTRAELAEPFALLALDHVLVDVHLKRGDARSPQEIFAALGVKIDDYDWVLDVIDPTRWFGQRVQRMQPRLQWPPIFDAYAERFALGSADAAPVITIGAHVQSETAHFYGYQKDWPLVSWYALFADVEAVAASTGRQVRFLLFGLQSQQEFPAPSCIDLRGKTSFLEMMALIKNYCDVLIAPDSGVLTMSYYLDTTFPIDLLSLWADPRQGILKQGVSSPNVLLRHTPVLAPDEEMSKLGVDQVLELLRPMFDSGWAHRTHVPTPSSGIDPGHL